MELVKNEEVVASTLDKGQRFLEKYRAQRSPYETIWEICDYMKNAAQNRTIYSAEKDEGANLDEDMEQANTGSTLFKRQISQLSAQGYAVQSSRDMPFKYVPLSTKRDYWSPEEAKAQADQRNILARWTMKQDDVDVKSIEFWDSVATYGNIPVMVCQLREKADVKTAQPIYEPRMKPDGSVSVMTVGYEDVIEEKITKNFPSLKIFPPDSVYADLTIGNLRTQECIIIVSKATRGDLLSGVRAGMYDGDAVKELIGGEGGPGKYEGGSATDVAKERLANRGIDTDPVAAAEQYYMFDILMRCPIEGNKWDEESTANDIYWITVAGQKDQISGGTCIRFDGNPDPDDKMPMEMMHYYPDSPDVLYHVSPAQIVRSNYSVECTLKNLAIDNAALRARPPMKLLAGMVSSTDNSYKIIPNQLFMCERSLADIELMEIPDNTAILVEMLNYISDDTQRALVTDRPFMGESFGARTSATEADNIMKSSLQPHLMGIKYVLKQFLGFYARKISRHWDVYAEPGQKIAITDSVEYPIITPFNLYGEFDIEIDVVDEFENDVVANQRIDETIKLIATVPALAASCDMTKLLVEWAKLRKVDYTRFVRPPQDSDADDVAHNENILMLQGMFDMVRVTPNQNHDIHIPIHEGMRIQYRGQEEQHPEMDFVDQHIEEHKMQQRQAEQPQAGTPPAGSGNETPGEVQGNQMAAAMGAQMGVGIG